MRELLILFGALIGWVLGYVFRVYIPGRTKEKETDRQQDFREANNRIRHLEAQISQYQNLQEQLNVCETQRQQKAEELERIRSQLVSAEQQIDALQQRLRQYENLEEQLNTYEARLQQKTEELESVNAKLTSAETQIDDLQQRLTSLEQQIQAENMTPQTETPLQTAIEMPQVETASEVAQETPPIVEPEAAAERAPQTVEVETPLEERPPADIEASSETEEPLEEETSETGLRSQPARAAAKESDNLRKIEGIGPKVAQLLNESGILTFEQLAQTEVDHLRAILEEAGGVFKAMDPASWPEQAALAAKEDWDALQTLQDELDGGRYKS